MLEKAFEDFTKAACKPKPMADMGKLNMLFRVDVSADTVANATYWIAVGGGNASAGAVPCRIFLLEATPVPFPGADDDPDATRVQLVRAPYIPTRRGLPFGSPVNCGLFKQSTHWTFACKLLRGRAQAPNFKVVMSKAKRRLVGGDQFHVTGLETSPPPAVVSFAVPVASDAGEQETGDGDVIDWDDVAAEGVQEREPPPCGDGGPVIEELPDDEECASDFAELFKNLASAVGVEEADFEMPSGDEGDDDDQASSDGHSSGDEDSLSLSPCFPSQSPRRGAYAAASP